MAMDPLNKDGGWNEFMELWIENFLGLDEMRTLHKNLLFVQKSMWIERWLAFLDVQQSADSVAAASFS